MAVRQIVVVVVIAVVAVAAGGLAVHMHWLPLPGFLSGKVKPHAQPTVDATVPQITTNLNGNAQDFAQVTLTVGLAGPKVAKAFTAQLPAVENAVIGDVRGMSLAQLNGTAGMQKLRQEVTASLDTILGQSGAVRDVYFTQFVVQ